MHTKYCPGCKEEKDLSEFSTMKVRNGIASHCRECNKKWAKAYYATEAGKAALRARYVRNKKRLRNNHLVREFGITLDQYNSMLDAQRHKCQICGKTPEENGKDFAVDHNHATGLNRGLLCSSCNICIGFIEKNKLEISTIENYLKKYNYGIPSHS